MADNATVEVATTMTSGGAVVAATSSTPQAPQKVVGDYMYSPETDRIGRGSFAVVYRARHSRLPGAQFAIKRVSKGMLNEKLAENLEMEISILKRTKHSNIVRLYQTHQTRDHIYLVMELCGGGDLTRYIKTYRRIGEQTTKHFSQQLAAALDFLHERNIVHRDLKPGNLLLDAGVGPAPPPGPAACAGIILKLADFGFARYLPSMNMAATLCGSPLYMAPEILESHEYDAKADLWSVGTILFECLTGAAPFRASNHIKLLEIIKTTSDSLTYPEGLSSQATNLLRLLLQPDPSRRLSFKEFFLHPFLDFKEYEQKVSLAGATALSTTPPSPPIHKSTIPPTPPHNERHMSQSPLSLYEHNASTAQTTHPSFALSPRVAVAEVVGGGTGMKESINRSNTSINDGTSSASRAHTDKQSPREEALARAFSQATFGQAVRRPSPPMNMGYLGMSPPAFSMGCHTPGFSYSNGGGGTSASASTAAAAGGGGISATTPPSHCGNAILTSGGVDTLPPFAALSNTGRTALAVPRTNPFRGSAGAVGANRNGEDNPGDSEYVIVDKDYVEVNVFADAMGALNVTSATGVSKLTPPKHTGSTIGALGYMRGLSSPSFGAGSPVTSGSPSNANAIGSSSHSRRRLSGGSGVGHSSIGGTLSSWGNYSPSQSWNEEHLLGKIDDMSKQAVAVQELADQKLQIAAASSSHAQYSASHIERDANKDNLASNSSSVVSPGLDAILFAEAAVLYIKAIKVFRLALGVVQRVTAAGMMARSPVVNQMVQWLRARFNSCLERAKALRLHLASVAESTNLTDMRDSHIDGDGVSSTVNNSALVCVEKVLYDSALVLCRDAAVYELRNDKESAAAHYMRGLRLLNAIVTGTPPELQDEQDREVLWAYLQGISRRLYSLGRRVDGSRLDNSRLSLQNYVKGEQKIE